VEKEYEQIFFALTNEQCLYKLLLLIKVKDKVRLLNNYAIFTIMIS